MTSVQRTWMIVALLLFAAVTLLGVSMTDRSPLFALSPAGLVLLAGGAVFAYAIITNQRWALGWLFVVAILVFSTNLRGEGGEIEEGAIKRTGFDAVSFVKLGLFAAGLLAGAGALRAIQWRSAAMPGLALMLYLAWAILTAPLSASPVYALGATVGLVGWILFAMALNDRFDGMQVTLLAIIACGLFCIASLVAYFAFPSFGQFYSFGVMRLVGLASTPNEAAQMASLCLIGILAFHLAGYRDRIGPLVRGWMMLSSVAALGVIFLAQTRGALAGTVIAAMALILQRYRAARASVLAVAIVAALGAIAFTASPEPAKFVAERASGVSRSGSADEIWNLAGRAPLWSVVIDQIGNQPVKGYGYGAGAKVIAENYATRWGEVTGSAHNAFLQTTLDLGLVGGALFVAIFVWSFREFLRNPSPFRDGVFIVVLITCLLESAVAKPAGPLMLLWLASLFVPPPGASAKPRDPYADGQAASAFRGRQAEG